MKRCLILALVSACTAVAQAVTIDWAQVISGATSAGSTNASLSLYGDSPAGEVADITYGVTIGADMVLSIGTAENDDVFTTLVLDSDRRAA